MTRSTARPSIRSSARQSARFALPEFTERTSSGTRTLDPYSKLLEERIVFLGTPIDDTSANDVMAQFMHLEYQAPDRDISLYINSPGGSFSAMAAVYDTMRFVSCEVETVCLGQAASAAAVLLAAGTPGKRYALPGARVLIQQPFLSEPVRGQASDLAVQADEMLRTRTRMEEMLARHTGRSRERIGADIERDMILDARQALEYGLVDRIVPSRKAALGAPGTSGGSDAPGVG
ncbi:ATP-dependent Clp protease proteolytic subunit [Streptomyces sp. NPDC017991]|uniref:ATP-dependent Clp protease proteolytic subunit n=1 Tax=Streptomyces sp. NPDC017991 TaxID=3365026 RepID=UPI003790FEE7